MTVLCSGTRAILTPLNVRDVVWLALWVHPMEMVSWLMWFLVTMEPLIDLQRKRLQGRFVAYFSFGTEFSARDQLANSSASNTSIILVELVDSVSSPSLTDEAESLVFRFNGQRRTSGSQKRERLSGNKVSLRSERGPSVILKWMTENSFLRGSYAAALALSWPESFRDESLFIYTQMAYVEQRRTLAA